MYFIHRTNQSRYLYIYHYPPPSNYQYLKSPFPPSPLHQPNPRRPKIHNRGRASPRSTPTPTRATVRPLPTAHSPFSRDSLLARARCADEQLGVEDGAPLLRGDVQERPGERRDGRARLVLPRADRAVSLRALGCGDRRDRQSLEEDQRYLREALPAGRGAQGRRAQGFARQRYLSGADGI